MNSIMPRNDCTKRFIATPYPKNNALRSLEKFGTFSVWLLDFLYVARFLNIREKEENHQLFARM